MSDNTDWIREGATVAEYDGHGYDARVNIATITKLTKTQIVVDNERRYSRERLTPIGGSSSIRRKILPAADPQVRDVQARRLFHDLEFDVSRMARNFTGGEADVLARLDEIEQAVRAARKAITGKES